MKFFKPIPVTDAIVETSSDNATYYTNVVEPYAPTCTLWAVGTTYAEDALVYKNYPNWGVYKSLAAGNVGNDPANSYGYWELQQDSEIALSAWSAATSYALGQRCYITTGVHKVYESVAAGNLNHHPAGADAEGWWIEVGSTNLFKMFDDTSGSYTEYLDTSAELAVPLVLWLKITNLEFDILAVLDSSGIASVTYQFFDTNHAAITGYPVVTQDMLAWDMSMPIGWYWWYFTDATPLSQMAIYLDKPVSAVYMKVTIQQNMVDVPINIGTFAFGSKASLGDTEWGASVGILDFSKKERDTFGRAEIIERAYAKTLSCDCFLTHEAVTMVYRKLAEVRATPVVWIGSDESLFDSTIIYGFYKNFSIVLESANGSMCNLEIEGLV